MADAEVKKRIKEARNDHDIHILALMRGQKMTKSEAMVMAYLDGPLGLDDRLSQANRKSNPAKPEATK